MLWVNPSKPLSLLDLLTVSPAVGMGYRIRRIKVRKLMN